MNPRSGPDRLGVTMVASSIAVLLIAGAMAGVFRAHRPVLDPRTGCQLGRPINGHVVILIDHTTPLTSDEAARLAARVGALVADGVAENELVSVWDLGNSPEGPLERRFCRCAPRRAAHPFYENPSLVAAAWESVFARPLRQAVSAITLSPGAGVTPLRAAIRELADQAEFAGAQGRRRIVIASDLLENTPEMSFYRSIPSRSSGARANLYGVAVELWYLDGNPTNLLKGQHLRAFWRKYFVACGASAVSFSQL